MEKAVVNCAGCLIYRKNDKINQYEILLCRPWRFETFGCPKGRAEEGETSRETAKREVFEETSYEVSPLQKIGSCVEETDDGEIKNVDIYLARMDDLSPPTETDGENAEVRWFQINNLPKLYEPQKNVILRGVLYLLKK